MRVLVVGAGVGGLTAGIALRRGGHDVTVFERRSDPGAIESGGGMVLWSNATRAFQRVGALEAVAAAGVALERFEWHTPGGTVLASWPVGDIGRNVGTPTVGIRRTRLQAALVDALGSEALRLGTEVTSFEQDAEGVTVHLRDGSSERGDVLVGADGINSVVRAQQHGGWKKPRFAGYALWFGIAPIGGPAYEARTFRETDGPGARFIYFPVGPNEIYWSAIANATEGEVSETGGENAAADRDLLLRRYSSWSDPASSLVEATEPTAIYRREIADRDPIKTWGEGRFTLLGDAAHAMTINLGQGACQAIEDGVVLADRLSRGTDAVASLRAYERERIPRTAWFVQRSRQIGDMGRWSSPPAVFFRNQIQRVIFRTVALSQQKQRLAYEF